MNYVTGITDNGAQVLQIPIADGSVATTTLAFRPNQIGWFYDLAWNGKTPSFALNGQRLVTSPNMLRQFRNQINFGIGIVTTDGGDPLNQQDFVNGYAQMVLLSTADVALVETTVFPGNP